MKNFIVKKIMYNDIKSWILTKHYAHRMPSISYSYGLFYNNKLVGVLTVGKPVSHYLCVNLCGEKYRSKVYELNRLFTDDNLPKNSLSFFVSSVLKLLATDKIILVSYADSSMNHHGYIYQATNWIYTGQTKQRTDKYTKGNKHSRHYTNNNTTNHLRKIRFSKYRYVYFTDKKMRKHPERYLNLSKYPILSYYPKGDNKSYIVGYKHTDTIINQVTKEIYKQ